MKYETLCWVRGGRLFAGSDTLRKIVALGGWENDKIRRLSYLERVRRERLASDDCTLILLCALVFPHAISQCRVLGDCVLSRLTQRDDIMVGVFRMISPELSIDREESLPIKFGSPVVLEHVFSRTVLGVDGGTYSEVDKDALRLVTKSMSKPYPASCIFIVSSKSKVRNDGDAVLQFDHVSFTCHGLSHGIHVTKRQNRESSHREVNIFGNLSSFSIKLFYRHEVSQVEGMPVSSVQLVHGGSYVTILHVNQNAMLRFNGVELSFIPVSKRVHSQSLFQILHEDDEDGRKFSDGDIFRFRHVVTGTRLSLRNSRKSKSDSKSLHHRFEVAVNSIEQHVSPELKESLISMFHAVSQTNGTTTVDSGAFSSRPAVASESPSLETRERGKFARLVLRVLAVTRLNRKMDRPGNAFSSPSEMGHADNVSAHSGGGPTHRPSGEMFVTSVSEYDPIDSLFTIRMDKKEPGTDLKFNCMFRAQSTPTKYWLSIAAQTFDIFRATKLARDVTRSGIDALRNSSDLYDALLTASESYGYDDALLLMPCIAARVCRVRTLIGKIEDLKEVWRHVLRKNPGALEELVCMLYEYEDLLQDLDMRMVASENNVFQFICYMIRTLPRTFPDEDSRNMVALCSQAAYRLLTSIVRESTELKLKYRSFLPFFIANLEKGDGSDQILMELFKDNSSMLPMLAGDDIEQLAGRFAVLDRSGQFVKFLASLCYCDGRPNMGVQEVLLRVLVESDRLLWCASINEVGCLQIFPYQFLEDSQRDKLLDHGDSFSCGQSIAFFISKEGRETEGSLFEYFCEILELCGCLCMGHNSHARTVMKKLFPLDLVVKVFTSEDFPLEIRAAFASLATTVHVCSYVTVGTPADALGKPLPVTKIWSTVDGITFDHETTSGVMFRDMKLFIQKHFSSSYNLSPNSPEENAFALTLLTLMRRLVSVGAYADNMSMLQSFSFLCLLLDGRSDQLYSEGSVSFVGKVAERKNSSALSLISPQASLRSFVEQRKLMRSYSSRGMILVSSMEADLERESDYFTTRGRFENSPRNALTNSCRVVIFDIIAMFFSQLLDFRLTLLLASCKNYIGSIPAGGDMDPIRVRSECSEDIQLNNYSSSLVPIVLDLLKYDHPEVSRLSLELLFRHLQQASVLKASIEECVIFYDPMITSITSACKARVLKLRLVCNGMLKNRDHLKVVSSILEYYLSLFDVDKTSKGSVSYEGIQFALEQAGVLEQLFFIISLFRVHDPATEEEENVLRKTFKLLRHILVQNKTAQSITFFQVNQLIESVHLYQWGIVDVFFYLVWGNEELAVRFCKKCMQALIFSLGALEDTPPTAYYYLFSAIVRPVRASLAVAQYSILSNLCTHRSASLWMLDKLFALPHAEQLPVGNIQIQPTEVGLSSEEAQCCKALLQLFAVVCQPASEDSVGSCRFLLPFRKLIAVTPALLRLPGLMVPILRVLICVYLAPVTPALTEAELDSLVGVIPFISKAVNFLLSGNPIPIIDRELQLQGIIAYLEAVVFVLCNTNMTTEDRRGILSDFAVSLSKRLDAAREFCPAMYTRLTLAQAWLNEVIENREMDDLSPSRVGRLRSGSEFSISLDKINMDTAELVNDNGDVSVQRSVSRKFDHLKEQVKKFLSIVQGMIQEEVTDDFQSILQIFLENRSLLRHAIDITGRCVNYPALVENFLKILEGIILEDASRTQALCDAGASELILTLLCSDEAHDTTLLAALKLANLMLQDGRKIIQDSFQLLLTVSERNDALVKIRGLLLFSISSSPCLGFHLVKDASPLQGEIWTEISIELFVFLQLLCEGHNLSMQDLLREQSNWSMQCNLISTCVAVFRSFDFNSSVSPDSARVLKQIICTLTEFIQGPCQDNQMCLCDSSMLQLIDVIVTDPRGSWSSRLEMDAAVEIYNLCLTLLLSICEGRKPNDVISRIMYQDLSISMMTKLLSSMDDLATFDESSVLLYTFILHMSRMCETDFLKRGQVSKQALDYLRREVRSIEFNGMWGLEVVHFRIPPICRLIQESWKVDIMWRVSRENVGAKLVDFVDRCENIEFQLDAKRDSGRFSHMQDYLVKLPIMRHLVRDRADMWHKINLVLTLVLNAILIVFLVGETTVESSLLRESWGHWLHELPYLPEQVGPYGMINLRAITVVLAVMHSITAALWTFNHFQMKGKLLIFKRWKRYLRMRGSQAIMQHDCHKLDDPEKFGISPLMYRIKSIRFVFMHPFTYYLIFYNIISWFGIIYPVFFAFHMVDLIASLSALRNVLKSITMNRKSIGFSMLLTFLVIYFFSVFGIVFLRSEYQHLPGDYVCDQLWKCTIYSTYHGFRSRIGFSDLLGTFLSTSDVAYVRIVVDLMFYVAIILLLSNVIFGVILDTNRQLRIAQAAVENDVKNFCFICNFNRSVFEKVGVSFPQHVTEDHNLYNYLYFFIHLSQKDPNEYTGPEQYVANILKDDPLHLPFFPVYKALCLPKQGAD
jgi:hypothetical protein